MVPLFANSTFKTAALSLLTFARVSNFFPVCNGRSPLQLRTTWTPCVQPPLLLFSAISVTHPRIAVKGRLEHRFYTIQRSGSCGGHAWPRVRKFRSHRATASAVMVLRMALVQSGLLLGLRRENYFFSLHGRVDQNFVYSIAVCRVAV